MMGTLLAGGFATQTAQAKSGAGEATSEPAAASATPQETTPRETATPTPEPSATPEPTEEETDAPSGTTCASPYTVQAGEWVYSIGRKCGLDPQAIIDANNLVPPYLLYPGDTLDLPGGSQAPDDNGSASNGACASPYTVKAGEWRAS